MKVAELCYFVIAVDSYRFDMYRSSCCLSEFPIPDKALAELFENEKKICCFPFKRYLLCILAAFEKFLCCQYQDVF